jgi:hypothetical protein
MPEAAMVINVGPIAHVHSNGSSGTFHILPKPPDAPFSLLVVYPITEYQDVGDHRTSNYEIEARPLASAIAGIGSDSPRARHGVLLCEAAPEIPKELLKAIKADRDFLVENPPQTKYVRKGHLLAAENIYAQGEFDHREALSAEIVAQRKKFEAYCRTLVTAQEVALANRNMHSEYARLIAEGDMMWQRPTEQVNISDLHRQACRMMGQERPWSYTAKQMFDCPGCGQKIQENAIVCGHCQAILDEPIAVLAAMNPHDRARKLYPERYAEAPALTPSGGVQGKGHEVPRR